MTDKEKNTLDDIVKSFSTREEEYKGAMGMMLDYYSNKANFKFAHSALMGGTESYIASVDLEWFASKVKFAADLPIFDENIIDKDSKRIQINKNTSETVLQRPLDWSRQAQLTQYLLTSPKHKFPPVLAVISQPWVYDPESDAWDEDGKALKSSADFKAFDSEGKFGLLDISPIMQVYALDGQHRLLGVKGLKKLMDGEALPLKSKNGTDIKDSAITVDSLKAEYGIDRKDIQNLGTESIGVEFISAVSEGETLEQARQRIRSIFVHVNKQAQKLKQGDVAQLEEDDGFIIVGRKIANTHDLFTKGHENRVNFNDKQISENSEPFTTLVHITEMSRHLLVGYFQGWVSMFKGVPPQRPDNDDLEFGQKIVGMFFDKFSKLPSIERMINGTSSGELRNFPEQEAEVNPFSNKKTPGEANILFRPIGQTALAKAIGTIIAEDTMHPTKLSDGTYDTSVLDDISKRLDKLFDKLYSFDKLGGFSYINKPNSIFYGILYDFHQNKMRVKGEKLAALLLKHLLKTIDDEDVVEDMRQHIADAREIDGEFKNYDGSRVSSEDQIRLPSPL